MALHSSIRFNLRSSKSVFLAASLLLMSACSDELPESQSQEKQADYIHSAQIERVSRQDSYNVHREYVGKLEAKQQTSMRFEFAGRISQVYKDSGDLVETGEVIASLDTELLSIQVDELEAQQAQLKAQLTLNSANLARIESLRNKDYASAQRFDELSAEKSILMASLDGLAASIATLNYQIDRAQLKAPYTGVVAQRHVSTGDLVSANMAAFSLVNQGEQQVSVGIPAEVAKTLSLKQTLPIVIAKNTYIGSILAIGQQVNPQTRTVEVRLALTEDVKIASGAIARVALEQTLDMSGFWVPLTAITDGIRGQWNVYAASPSEHQTHKDVYQISAKTIQVLHTTEERAYITGLGSDAIELVTTGLHRYVPGQQVKNAETQLAGGNE